jgi:hypothetical protein
MTFFDPEHMSVPERKANTLVVVVLLIVAAAVFSWLGAYPLTTALVSNDLVRAWPPDQDPRPTHLVVAFVSLLTVFFLAVGGMRLLSARQFRRIDGMVESE